MCHAPGKRQSQSSNSALPSLWTMARLTPAQSSPFSRDQGGSQGTDTEVEAEQGGTGGTGSVALPQGTCVCGAFLGKPSCSVATFVPILGLVCHSVARAHPYKVRR